MIREALRRIVRRIVHPPVWRETSVLAVVLGLAIAGSWAAADGEPAKLPEQWAGTWTLRQDLGAPGITALTDEQATSLLGERIRISDQEVKFGREVCIPASFRVDKQTATDFLADYRVSQDQFPLFGTMVEILDIKCKRSVTHRFGRLENGCTLLAKDGRFYQITRQTRQKSAAGKGAPQCLDKR